MKTYVIERTVPGAGQMDAAALGAIAAQSNTVLRELGPDVQWVHSYVTDDKITCIYRASGPDIVRDHGRCGGFPSTRCWRCARRSTRRPRSSRAEP
jgi:Protein of unknown function (DUF4242)